MAKRRKIAESRAGNGGDQMGTTPSVGCESGGSEFMTLRSSPVESKTVP